ncbi:MAG: ATP synthase F1 subunit delta [Candidatus Omnitrophica bacterium]|nr:ATP synthase subunit delta [bacterium]NUN96949.1 ATP synthase F1 subunit delta [Candidatus Omnitrophota bacterium]
MAYTSVLAQRYADGLLRVVRGTDQLPVVARDLHTFLDLFGEGSRLREVMLDPAYDNKTRLELLGDLRAKLGLSEITHNFLRLVIRKRRIAHLEQMVAAFDELGRREAGVIQAEVTVPAPADEAAKAKIAEVVAKITGKKPELEFTLDPSIIGGVRIRMGNSILDASVKTKLERLRETLTDPAGALAATSNS